MEKKRVVIGMSGGVDSSVAAYLLKEMGYDVIGVTMQIWQKEDVCEIENGGCCGLSAVEDARKVAYDLKIPYYVMNFRREFEENVIQYFIKEYLSGKTPNPCIACNRYVKWDALLKRSLEIGADYIATGHYAQIVKLKDGRFSLKKSVTDAKDQTYALYSLTQEQLSKTLMPIGAYTKEEVRKIAKELGLTIASKKDSQEICFVPDKDYARYIKEHTDKEILQGNFVTTDGAIIGKHKGITHYTVGQRKGLNLALGHRAFVTEIRPDTNEVVIGDETQINKQTVYANHLNFMKIETLQAERRVMAKIRYNHKGAYGTVRMIKEDVLECRFDEPQRAITPGQALVLYEEDCVLGGGTILGAV